MFGKRRRRVKSVSKTSSSSSSERVLSGPTEQEAEFDLPTEILESILSRLSLADNVRASLVCRRWHTVAGAVRKSNKAPWLMYFPKSGHQFDFYDPSSRKTNCLNFPELQHTKICYAKYGWFLCYEPSTHHVFFFNPCTREVIKCPKLRLAFLGMAFSAPPTSLSCTLFMVNHVMANFVAVSTCHPADSAWTTVNYESEGSFLCSLWNKAVFSNRRFYCLSLTGFMGIYDPEQRTWSVLPIDPPERMKLLPLANWWKQKFLVEHDGEIFVLYACPSADTALYKLDEVNNRWEKIEDLGGMTIFANFVTSHIRTDLLGNMRNNIYFPKVMYFGQRCVTYSMREQRYFPRREGFNFRELDLFDNVWIDAPEDLSAVL